MSIAINMQGTLVVDVGVVSFIYITSRFDTPNVGALHRSRRAARRDAADMTIYF